MFIDLPPVRACSQSPRVKFCERFQALLVKRHGEIEFPRKLLAIAP
jgi:hypothetical protein